ncbi:Disease resistance protein RPP8 [Rhynchospora pubera]|uniref:Disease resistance protein RPP8 n=1 Tax=Rhynchospora pubera TaxID=906938 RepID=A0AAV8HB67_9POAL|nr:Disease resistance protein RPP8 [Rhynchospora pubera]
MTQAIVSGVVTKLADLILEQVRFLSGIDSKIGEVKLQFSQMQRFLIDADSKSKRGDERVKGWIRDIRSVAYETEDAIDTFLVEANHQRFIFFPNRLFARLTLGQKISKIQAKLRIISESRTTFGIKDFSEDTGQLPFQRHVLPDVDNGDIVGFEAEKGDVIDLLLHGPCNNIRHVVTIVGPGGLGKTTLAQMVYSSVKRQFDICLWITISKDFNIIDVLKKILQKLQHCTEAEGQNAGDRVAYLLGEVNTLLRQRKYLIVLDDVWSEDVFTQLETALIDIGNGSRVLMTSRSLNVATRADSYGVYHLSFLNEEESLGLFLKKALVQSSNPSPECPVELLHLAKMQVKRCGGLPLALIVLGGLLSSKPRTHQQWSKVFEMLNWHTHGQECMGILATSYNDLPHFLKTCFRYLACFPVDYRIPSKPLMKMWIAEGFIEASGAGQLEDYAEEFLEELAQRCLVQVVERSFNGSIKSVRVHDLLREIALSEAAENDFLLIWKEEDEHKDLNMTRRVAFHEGIDASSTNNRQKDLRKISMPKLRTFLSFNRCIVISIGFILLRVLELRNTYGFERLPSGPPGIANLVNLRSLGRFWVPESWKKNLPHFPGIRKLQLRCQDNNDGRLLQDLLSKSNSLHSVRLDNFYPPQNIIDLRISPSYDNIHTLILSGYEFGCTRNQIVQIAKMPPNLTKLTLSYFHLNEDPMPTLEKLHSLKSLELSYIYILAETMVCSSGAFPQLERLKLDYVPTVKEWKVVNGAFPVLKYLVIGCCYCLQALPDLRCVTTLQELNIDELLLSEIMEKSGEEWQKVEHIPKIQEY